MYLFTVPGYVQPIADTPNKQHPALEVGFFGFPIARTSVIYWPQFRCLECFFRIVRFYTILLWPDPTETLSRSFKVYQEILNERVLINEESLTRSGLYG